MPATLRHLTSADLQALLPTARDWVALVEDTLKQLGAAGADGGAGTGAASSAGGASTAAVAGTETATADAGAAAADTPGLSLDAQAFAIGRDAACVAVAAKYLADPKSEVLTLLGADLRGRAIIEALVSVLPNSERMLCFDPDVSRQERFADEVMTQLNLASIVPTDPREAVEGAHILILNLAQGGAWPAPIIEADWLQRGTLIFGLYPGAGLTPAARKQVDRRVTDNLAAYAAAAAATFAGEPAPDSDLASIVAGRAPGRGAGQPLILYYAFGSPALNAALTAELMRRAERANRGTVKTA